MHLNPDQGCTQDSYAYLSGVYAWMPYSTVQRTCAAAWDATGGLYGYMDCSNPGGTAAVSYGCCPQLRARIKAHSGNTANTSMRGKYWYY